MAGGIHTVGDVLAIGKFGTIPERPVQSRPVRAGLYYFQVPQGSLLVYFLSYVIVSKTSTTCRSATRCKLVERLSSAEAFDTMT